uniref:DUF8040 domain-containing protein n=1 Tax=Setaria italica TaxID=4555 RepID=K3ZCM2_SETIT
MEVEIFRAIANLLRAENLLRDTRGVKIEEQLGMFLFMLSCNASIETLKKAFQHSGETIHRKVNEIFNIIPTLTHRFIKLPNPNQTQAKILSNPRFMPFFQSIWGVEKQFLILKIKIPAAAAVFHNIIRAHNGQDNWLDHRPQYINPTTFVDMLEGDNSYPTISTSQGTRAAWSYTYEKGLVNVMKEHVNISITGHKMAGQLKQQVQDKEKGLKESYKIIKEARKSGVGWNDILGMIIAEPN